MAPTKKVILGGGNSKAGSGPGAGRRAMLSALLVMGVAMAVASLGWFGFRAVWLYVVNLEEFRVRPIGADLGVVARDPKLGTTETVVDGVEWLKAEALRSDLLRSDATRVLNGSWSLFSRGLAERVAGACRASPWVRRVVAVERRFPRTLLIKLTVRRPFAVVQVGQAEVLVDHEQFVLPAAIYNRPFDGEAPRPAVRLGYRAKPPAPGLRWEDEGVRGGLAMLSLILEKRLLEFVAIDGIEISREGWLGRKRVFVALRTRSGAVVKWGHPPIPTELPAPDEVRTESKVRALLAKARDVGPGLPGIGSVDVRWDRPVSTPK